MLYNPLLDTFIQVVDCGSFTKASEKLYISSTAIMKQMNTLEHQLNMKLIDRTPTGIKLTSAGQIIYDKSKEIKLFSDNALSLANKETQRYETTFCVGTSLLNPAKPFIDLWYKINKNFPGYQLHLVPYNDDTQDVDSEIKQLGEKFDFLIGVNDSKLWLSMANFLQLGTYKKMVAVSYEHPLANKKVLNIEDLYGQTLMMVPQGDSGVNDFIRHQLSTYHPQIKIEDTSLHYDMAVFNKAAESRKVLLMIECWQHVHPGLVTIPVNWDYEIPYGILYSKDAPQDVLQFIDVVKEYLKTTQD